MTKKLEKYTLLCYYKTKPIKYILEEGENNYGL